MCNMPTGESTFNQASDLGGLSSKCSMDSSVVELMTWVCSQLKWLRVREWWSLAEKFPDVTVKGRNEVTRS